jgi:hypothetical protein
MALDESSNNGFYMPVAPAYAGGNGGGFGGGFGGDWGWIILLLLFAGGGWGNGGFGGGFGGGYDFPWILTGQQNINANTNNGFRDAMINDNITSVRDGINSLSTQLCGCCGDMQMALANGFAGVEQGANARQIANMQTAFAAQMANAQGFNGVQAQIAEVGCDNRAAINDVKYTIAAEECATRANSTQNTQSILNLVNSGIQSIKDQLCQDKIDAKNDEISALRQQIAMKDLAASQVAQNAFIAQGFSNEVDQLYNRLNSCPVPTTPVYGRTPIFTCNNNGCGCGCGSF